MPPSAAEVVAWAHAVDVWVGTLETASCRLAERAAAKVGSSGPSRAAGEVVDALRVRTLAVAGQLAATAAALRPPPRRAAEPSGP